MELNGIYMNCPNRFPGWDVLNDSLFSFCGSYHLLQVWPFTAFEAAVEIRQRIFHGIALFHKIIKLKKVNEN